jgi:predicted tellurium resistance membrane protein TerC
MLVTGEAMVVPVQTSLSLTSRWLTRVIVVTYLLLGLIMFVVIIIVIATLLNIGIFHFSAHPRHIAYLATCFVVMIGTVLILRWDRRETSRAAKRAGLAAPAPSWPAQAGPAPRR